jgi:hypothetical protein
MTSTPQEYWDVCLIKTWREHKQVFDAVKMFKSITGKEFFEYDPPLKRTPRLGMPWQVSVRHFVAHFLPKISERLWEQPPERDVALLRKLTTSEYTTLKSSLPVDGERNSARKETKSNLAKVKLANTLYGARNDATNGSVVKGAVRHRRMK